jgi:Domain of unknown function (DUF1877)
MAGRGSFIAITPEQMDQLVAIRYESDLDTDERDVLIWEASSRMGYSLDCTLPYSLDTDKAWDAIHRCLTGDLTPSPRLNRGGAQGPLERCVLGGEQLIESPHYTVSLVRPEQVPEVAAALTKIDRAELRRRFYRLDPEVTDYPISEREFEYTWSGFEGLPALFVRATDEGRAVLFRAIH